MEKNVSFPITNLMKEEMKNQVLFAQGVHNVQINLVIIVKQIMRTLMKLNASFKKNALENFALSSMLLKEGLF